MYRNNETLQPNNFSLIIHYKHFQRIMMFLSNPQPPPPPTYITSFVYHPRKHKKKKKKKNTSLRFLGYIAGYKLISLVIPRISLINIWPEFKYYQSISDVCAQWIIMIGKIRINIKNEEIIPFGKWFCHAMMMTNDFILLTQ